MTTLRGSMLIGGRWVGPDGRETREITNPANGSVQGLLALATKDDLDEALAASERAFASWQRTPAAERAEILKRAADILAGRASEIGRITTLEQGKPLAQATREVHGAANSLRWFAEESRRADGRLLPTRKIGRVDSVLRRPLGPVAAFSPWNFPITIPARKIGASLAAGCTCILKPAEETPATAIELGRALCDAGLPEGVLAIVFGVPGEVAEHLVTSPVVRKVSFTGSTTVGREIARLASVGPKPLTLELGGHAPVLVFDDADMAKTAALSASAKFQNSGQTCIAPTRFYVQEGVYQEFCDRLVEQTQGVVVGDGLNPETTMGPLTHERRPPYMAELVTDAVAAGARVLTGGGQHGDGGNFWEPTVLADVDNSARAMNEEPFGPIALVTPFRTTDDAIRQGNRLPFGLAAYAFTSSPKVVYELGESLETGMLAVNHFGLIGPEAPFGGVKDSGYGSEGGQEGLNDYLFSKFVSHETQG